MKHLILKPYRKQPVTIRMNVEQLARIDQLIAQYGLNRSEFINRCIDFGLASMPEAAPMPPYIGFCPSGSSSRGRQAANFCLNFPSPCPIMGVSMVGW